MLSWPESSLRGPATAKGEQQGRSPAARWVVVEWYASGRLTSHAGWMGEPLQLTKILMLLTTHKYPCYYLNYPSD